MYSFVFKLSQRITSFRKNAAVAQSGERHSVTVEVVGSKPISCAIILYRFEPIRVAILRINMWDLGLLLLIAYIIAVIIEQVVLPKDLEIALFLFKLLAIVFIVMFIRLV